MDIKYSKEEIARSEAEIGISIENSSVIDAMLAVARVKAIMYRCHKIFEKHETKNRIPRHLLEMILDI